MLIDLQNEIYILNGELKELKYEYEKNCKRINDTILAYNREINMLLCGADVDKIKTAEKILDVYGMQYFGKGDTIETWRAAIKDVSSGIGLMRTEYFGCKNYSGWVCQGSNHTYGCGPSHGNIVFKIALKRELLNKTFTEQEIEACLYYLLNMEKEDFRNSINKK